MPAAITIRPPEPADKDAWWALWQGYITFYESKIAGDVTEATWTRLLDDGLAMFGYVACDGDGKVVGFVHNITHDSTWDNAKDCYLEDLYVDPAVRGQGVGATLIEAVVEKAKNEGWRKVYWKTDKNNVTARRLYDRFTAVGEWVTYEVDT